MSVFVELLEGRRLMSVATRTALVDGPKVLANADVRVVSPAALGISADTKASAKSRTAPASMTPDKPPFSELNTIGTRPLGLEAETIAGGGIRIKWPALGLDSSGEIVVFRKALTDDLWTDIAIGLPGFAATQFEDLTAVTGVAYEYKVVVYTTLGAAPYEKYILAGNQAAATSDRGTVLLVVDATQLDPTRDTQGTTLAPALRKYKADLIADGYRVLQITAPRVDVPRTYPAAADPENPTPAEIAAHSAEWFGAVTALKGQIRSLWQTTPDLKSVVLIGHVPVPYSGAVSPDVTSGHESSLGAWPADIFYGTLSTPDSIWTDELTIGTTDAHINLPGDGKFDADYLSQIGLGTEYENRVFADVAIGRIDFAMLNNFAGVNLTVGEKAGVGETKLLARYLEKTYEFRSGQWDVTRQALFEEAFPFGEYYDTNRLTPNVGIGKVIAGTVSPYEPNLQATDQPYPPNVPPPTTYDLHNQSWLWLYAGAGGYPPRNTIHYNPNRQLRSDQYSNGIYASSTDFTQVNNFGNHKAVFNFIYGSYVGDWDYQNALLRSVIAEPDGYGLVSMWGARPVWEQHHMGLGEPLSVSTLKTWNNFGSKQAYMYDPNSSSTRALVLGDPTLRQDHVKPASDVRVELWSAAGNKVVWDASADASVAGYYVYAATSPEGPFTLLNNTPVTGTQYLDSTNTSPAGLYYMVRATKLEITPSGSYWNLALGAFSAPQVTGAAFNRLDRPHSVDFTFSQDVGSSLTASDFVVTGNRYDFSTRTYVPATFVADVDFHLASYDPQTRVARIVFDLQNERGVAQIIPSGRYSVSFAPGAVSNDLGMSVDVGYAYQLAYLNGDTSGDLVVNFTDLLTLAQRYGSVITNNPFSQGDFNDDGRVSFDDLLLLAQNYGTVLP